MLQRALLIPELNEPYTVGQELVYELARKVLEITGEGRIRSLVPHGKLHSVPWRAALRHIGVEWDKMQPGGVEFGLLMRRDTTGVPKGDRCIALGAGTAGPPDSLVDLCDEACGSPRHHEGDPRVDRPHGQGQLELGLLPDPR